MHIQNFKTFCDLVETQSFSKAAKLNEVTQSAVSQQPSDGISLLMLIIDQSKKFRLTPGRCPILPLNKSLPCMTA